MSDINFSKLTWENLPARTTALSATNLNRIENGIADSVNGVNSNSHSIAELQTRISQIANGSPTPVATVAEMTDESAVYLYTGSESGYTAGNWYFWNGSAWTSGGTYGGAVTDTTLSISGAPADAKAVGDALAEKADADDVTALETAVESKADADDVEVIGDRVSDLESGLDSIEPIFSDCFDTEQHTETTTNTMEWSAQYYDLNTGELKTLTGYSHTEKFPCEAGDVVGIGLNTGQVLFWNGSTYLSYVATSGSTGMNITAPAGATLYACNNRDINYRPTESTVTKTWTEKVLKVTSLGTRVTEAEGDVEDVKEELNSIEPIFSDYFETEQHTNVTTNNMTWSAQYYDLTTGELKTLTGYSHTDQFPCDAGDIIGIGLNTGQVLFWGKNGYLSYVATSPSTAMQITAPVGATKYACNNRNVDYRPDTTTLTKTWTEKVLISKEYDAPAQVLYTSDAFINKRYANTVDGNLLTGDSYASWYCVYKMPCKANHNYRTTHQTQVCFYDAQGTFISAYIPTKNGANVTGAKVEMDFTTPVTCAYISINSNFATETVFDLDYVEYGNGKSVYPLIGKTIVCFGDSITGNYCFGDNYPYQIEKETGAKVYNVGFGGCRMELTNESPILYVNPFSMVSLADAIVSEASDKWSTQDSAVESFAAKIVIYKRLEMLKNIDFSQVDIITIAYGTNGVGLPLDDAENPLSTYTYAGATRYAIKTLLAKYPHLRIMLMTPIYRWYSATSDDGDTHQVGGQTLLDRVTKLLEVGAEIKIPTIDLYHTLGINKYNYTGYFGDDDETADGTHINSFGREQMGLRVAGELNRLF